MVDAFRVVQVHHQVGFVHHDKVGLWLDPWDRVIMIYEMGSVYARQIYCR